MVEAMTPSAAVRKAFATMAAWGDDALFISALTEDQALARAAEIEARGPETQPLYGLTFAIKDNIDFAGLPTTAACPDFAYDPATSAEVVKRLEAAGAIAIGKTNLDQFATGLVGVRSPYGVPRNALNPRLIPGGSSSGSATAVAAGIVDFSLGTDTAGSGRIPAGMNGIVGLKPSLGLLSTRGVVPACRTLDTVSVFARSVDLAVAVTSIAAGYDAEDPWSRRRPIPSLGGVPARFRVGVPAPDKRLFFGDSAAEAAYAADLERLRGLGAELLTVDFEPLHEVARLLYEGPWVAERYAATRRLIETSPESFCATTLKIIDGAQGLSAVSTFESFYRLAELRRAAEAILGAVDCLAVPTVPRIYEIAEVEAEPMVLNSNLGSYTNFVNLLDLAAISVPVGARDDGLPSSLTLIGKGGTDGYLASIARGLGLPPIDRAPPQPAAGRIGIAVVGAHLSGLPLNDELKALGASFVRSAETRPDYRLFALPDTSPPKPGLLRVGADEGAPIAVEIWSLSPEGFGRFVAGIPAPLGIGTLNLNDGTRCKGFLCEAEALKGAGDISSFGGWRAYLESRAGAGG